MVVEVNYPKSYKRKNKDTKMHREPAGKKATTVWTQTQKKENANKEEVKKMR